MTYNSYYDSSMVRGSGTGQGQQGGISFLNWLGFGAPVPEHAQPYGTGPNIPTGWCNHRLTYPRTPAPVLQQMYGVPTNSPAFPRRDDAWMFSPPAEQDF
jgi:hypothetical protein